MGEVELNNETGEVIITSVICIYGEEAGDALANQIAADIQLHWNEPDVSVIINRKSFRVRFVITGVAVPDLAPETVWFNDNPQLNYFRVEKFAVGNISFVDGIGCNTGYLKLDNLLQTSTTAAHEYGHTIGLEHPKILDIRGVIQPGIMYPRGTWCDPHFQYDPNASPGEHGGFLDPQHRRVSAQDVYDLQLNKLHFNSTGTAILGEFTSLYHEKHS